MRGAKRAWVGGHAAQRAAGAAAAQSPAGAPRRGDPPCAPPPPGFGCDGSSPPRTRTRYPLRPWLDCGAAPYRPPSLGQGCVRTSSKGTHPLSRPLASCPPPPPRATAPAARPRPQTSPQPRRRRRRQRRGTRRRAGRRRGRGTAPVLAGAGVGAAGVALPAVGWRELGARASAAGRRQGGGGTGAGSAAMLVREGQHRRGVGHGRAPRGAGAKRSVSRPFTPPTITTRVPSHHDHACALELV